MTPWPRKPSSALERALGEDRKTDHDEDDEAAEQREHQN
jgi:hypothetical protein